MKRSLVGAFVVLGFSVGAMAQISLPAPSTRPVVKVPDTVTIEPNIKYSEYPDTVLDILHPKAESKEKRPGVVVFHGGGWVQSNKESTIDPICLPFVAQGFVVCNVEYRVANIGQSPAKAPAAVVDSMIAAKWFVDHADKYNMDVNRLVIAGASAGGHLALMVGMVTPEAKLGPVVKAAAIVNYYGPTDVNDLIKRGTGFAGQWLPEQEGREALARKLSPMTYVRKDLPPIFTIQGENDRTVPVEQNVWLTDALKKAGASAEMVLIPGAGHGPARNQSWDAWNQKVFDFLKKQSIIKS